MRWLIITLIVLNVTVISLVLTWAQSSAPLMWTYYKIEGRQVTISPIWPVINGQQYRWINGNSWDHLVLWTTLCVALSLLRLIDLGRIIIRWVRAGRETQSGTG